MVTILCVARAELALYLLSRVLKRGKDDRFDAMRGHFASFATFWFIQALWAWGVSLAVVFVATDAAAGVPLDGRDGAGAALAVAGFLLEVWADLVKDRFRSDPANAGRACDVGPWAWSRHPNFFGEIALWWGLWLHGVPVYEASGRAGAGYYTLASPLLTMVLLLFLSGMPTAEGVHQRRFLRTPGAKAAYLAYRARTSPLLPLPPALYRPLPLWLKRAALLELRMYETDWDWTPGAASTANPASGVGGGGGGGGGDAVAGKDTALLAGGAGGPDGGGYGAAR
jgi:steroid 5-alpha reductase family enzyme